MQTKIYAGKKFKFGYYGISVIVTVNGKPLKYWTRYSSTGFDWGHAGAGTKSTDLALSILWNLLKREPSKLLYINFRDEFVMNWGDEWKISSAEIRRWMQLQTEVKKTIKERILYPKLINLQNKIKKFIRELKQEKEYYKSDIRYNLYEKIISKLEILIEEEEIKERRVKNVNNENSHSQK